MSILTPLFTPPYFLRLFQSRLHSSLLDPSLFEFNVDNSISDDSGKVAVVDEMIKELMLKQLPDSPQKSRSSGASRGREKIVLVSNYRQVRALFT